jgi:tRNA pseudouridine55 synthase
MNTVSGVLIVDKPMGLTSHDVVYKLRKQFGWKVGHAGTLDPLATGVLPLLINDGTKISNYLTVQTKKYEVTFKLGISTDTLDSEGKITKTTTVPQFSLQQINSTLDKFRGKQTQLPPMFSAVKQNGKRLYKLAREGKTVERKPRNIDVTELILNSWNYPDISLTITCTKGTYIRQLASDIGDNLGAGGHVIALRRTASGKFTLNSSTKLEKLLTMANDQINPIIINNAHALDFMKSKIVNWEEARELLHGLSIDKGTLPTLDDDERFLCLDDQNNLLAIVNIKNEKIAVVKNFPEEIFNYIERNNCINNNNHTQTDSIKEN